MTSPFPDRPTFFDEGIRFECTQCGNCCTGAPGLVRLDNEEAQAMAEHLKVSLPYFYSAYVRTTGDGPSLRERSHGDCVFFMSGKCVVYPVRPTQCRTYPFWFKNLRSEARWSQTCESCPGIGRGKLYSRSEILSMLRDERALTS